jgi:hypothetical protein
MCQKQRQTPLIQRHPTETKPTTIHTDTQLLLTLDPNNILKMNMRQRIQILIIMFLILLTFANYHKGTGSTAWLQFLTITIMFVFGLVFDLAFTDNSNFIFDPDADNWRRKTEAISS